MNIILEFYYKGKTYVGFLTRKNQLLFGYHKNSNFIICLTPDELKVIKYLCSKLWCNPLNNVFCGVLNFLGNSIRVYENFENRLFTFSSSKEIPQSVYCYLNLYFNNDPEILYYNKISQFVPSPTLNRLIRIGHKIIVNCQLSLTLNPLFAPETPQLSNLSLVDIESHKLSIDSFDYIKQAIVNNDNLRPEEKNFLLEFLEDEYNENREFMDLELICSRLRTLKINYEVNKSLYCNHTDGTCASNEVINYTAGSYDIPHNIITLIGGILRNSDGSVDNESVFDFKIANKLSLMHEINHLISDDKCDSPDIFRESIDELFALEYYYKYHDRYHHKSNGYEDYMPYIYALAEILPPKALRQYKFSDNVRFLISALMDLDNAPDNYERASDFMLCIRSINLYFSKIAEYRKRPLKPQEEAEFEKLQMEVDENYQKIHDYYAYYFKLKYDRDMETDIIMLTYLYDTPFITDKEEDIVDNYYGKPSNVDIKFIPKGYLSEFYSQTHQNLQVSFIVDGITQTFEISDDQRNLSQRMLVA